MNLIFIIGNITRTPETRAAGETTVCNFDVAVNRDYKREGQPDADFFRVAAFGKLGESCQKYLDKGKKVAVTGEVSCRAYEAKDGTAKASLEVRASKVEFLTPKAAGANPEADAEMQGFTDINSDDIPF